jgi:serine protease Do/serine protease DegQ
MRKCSLTLPSLLLGATGVLLSGNATATLPVSAEGTPVPSLAPMLERVTPAVVNISTRSQPRAQENPLLSDPFFRRFFNLPEPKESRPSRNLGSGVIVDAKQGYVLTNNHVIDDADQITVTLRDGRHFEARLVGTDPEVDIAVVEIPAEQLDAVPMADSDQLRVGDFVVAIGNPFGLGQTVTSGIVSALGRTGLGIEGYEDFIQTDASINPGNSGGPLVNLRGELVGINTAILAPSGGNVGIGFAIPVNMARNIMAQLVRYGEVQRGLLGITSQDITPDLANAFGLKARSGAVVVAVAPKSPAALAGVEVGDIIISLDGRAVRDSSELRNRVGLKRVGTDVKLDLLRAGKPVTISAAIASSVVERADGGKFHPRLAGASLGTVIQDSPTAEMEQGVQVLAVKPDSAAAAIGLSKDDVIVSVNRAPVSDLDTLRQAVRRSPNGLLLTVRRGDSLLSVLLR